MGREIEAAVNDELDFLESLVRVFSDDTLDCEFGLTVSDSDGSVILRSGSIAVGGSAAASVFETAVSAAGLALAVAATLFV